MISALSFKTNFTSLRKDRKIYQSIAIVILKSKNGLSAAWEREICWTKLTGIPSDIPVTFLALAISSSRHEDFQKSFQGSKSNFFRKKFDASRTKAAFEINQIIMLWKNYRTLAGSLYCENKPSPTLVRKLDSTAVKILIQSDRHIGFLSALQAINFEHWRLPTAMSKCRHRRGQYVRHIPFVHMQIFRTL